MANEPAPGDTVRLTWLEHVDWQVLAVWKRVNGDYSEHVWAEIYNPVLGRWLAMAGDPAERLYHCPRLA